MQTTHTKYLHAHAPVRNALLLPPLVISATVLIALCAHFSLPLLFTPVPMTLQTFAVLMAGMLLGPRMGFFTLCTYLLEGAIGLPVFSPQGLGGIAQLLGPTGGYLVAYPLAAFLAGWGAHALRRKLPVFVAAVISCSAAVVCILAIGALWLHAILHLSAQSLWISAIAPFLPGEVLKIGAAASLYTGWQRWRSR